MKIEGNVIKLRGAETTIDVDAPLRIKDGASFVDVRNYIAPVFQYENLVVKNNSGTPNSKIDVSWDSLYIGPIHSTTYTQTLNIESDTDWDSGDHTDEPANGFVYVHAFAKADGTEVCKFSLSATAPTLPTDYLYSRRIAAPRNTSGNFVTYYQKNDRVFLASNDRALTFSTNVISVTDIIPSIAKTLTVAAAYSATKTDFGFQVTIKFLTYIGGAYRTCGLARSVSLSIPDEKAYASGTVEMENTENGNISIDVVTGSTTASPTTSIGFCSFIGYTLLI